MKTVTASGEQDQKKVRNLAWLGDAILSLYTRRWLLSEPSNPQFSQHTIYSWFTSNEFLVNFGEPTRVEARIAEIDESYGLEAAFAHIDQHLKPRFLRELKNRMKNR